MGTTPRPLRRAAVLAVVTCVAGAGACSAQDKPPAAPKVTLVELDMGEYRFAFRNTLPRGRVVVVARNVGKLAHEVVVVRRPDRSRPGASPPADLQRLVSHPVGYMRAKQPRDQGSFAIDVAPGRYLVGCFVRDPDGRTHAQKGMRVEVRVR